MSFLIVLASLCFLMFIAYRGYSVILFAPVAALGAVLLTDPTLVAPMFTGLFMDKMVGFVKNYFPVFLLGAIFGKVIELSGFSKAIVSSVIKLVGAERAMLSIVLVCALLTYGGVSLFVVVFAVYPFAAEMFRQGGIPKRLIPGTIALGAFTFTMDSLPGTPQIQNVIPTTFFKTNIYAAPVLGTVGAVFIFIVGLSYLEWRRRTAKSAGEGYGTELLNEPEPFDETEKLANPVLAILPLVLVGVTNKLFTDLIPTIYGKSHSFVPAVIGKAAPVVQDVSKIAAIWAVEGALLVGILTVLVFAWRTVSTKFAEGTKAAVGGALLAYLTMQRGSVPVQIFAEMRSGTLGFIGYSLFAGFAVPGIDNAAHFDCIAGPFEVVRVAHGWDSVKEACLMAGWKCNKRPGGRLLVWGFGSPGLTGVARPRCQP